MSDDFGTVNLRRGDRTREIEVLRQHRESLVKMLAEVDQQLRELELTAPPPLPAPSHPTHPALRGYEDREGPASRPIVNTTQDYEDSSGVNPGSGMRVVLILGVALLALALIGWLIWRASSNRSAATSTVVEESTAADTTTTAPATMVESETIAPVPTNALTVRPSSQDYGLVRKGTRTTRQYEIANNSEEPISIALARSACRCLYYEHAPVIPPKAKESVTVTIDGAKAKAGTLRETIRVTAKSDAAVATSFEVIATVR
jgi:type II secretory pathway component PulM